MVVIQSNLAHLLLHLAHVFKLNFMRCDSLLEELRFQLFCDIATGEVNFVYSVGQSVAFENRHGV